MKILLTQDTDWIKRNPHQQHHLAERLVLRGHKIKVIDYDLFWNTEGKMNLFSKKKIFSNVSKILDGANIEVIRPGILRIPILDYVSMLFTYRLEIDKQIKKYKPDLLINQSILTNYIGMKLSKKYNIPCVFHLLEPQNTIIPFSFLRPFGKILERKLLKSADCVIVINEKLREYAIEMGANPKNTYTVRAGIDLKKYDPNIDGNKIRKKYGFRKNDIVLFFMGWLYHFSGLKELTKELSKIDNNEIKILIVGDGDAFEDLKKIREKYGLEEQIVLTGRQPYESMPQFIASSDICLLPAYNNDIMKNIVPIKMYEYMAMKKPVISTKLPGIMREFKRDNGVLYVDKPEDVLSKAIKLIESKLIEQKGKQARKFVENQDWDKITDKFEQLLIKIIQNKQGIKK